MNFEDSDIKINPGCAVFVTTESMQAERENIPDNLKVKVTIIFHCNFVVLEECKVFTSKLTAVAQY